MNWHLFKLVWRRKGANALLILEIAISYLVLFAVCLGALFYVVNARQPLGFEGEGLWAVAITREGQGVRLKSDGDQLDLTRRVLKEALRLPQVESAALIENAPYEMSQSNTRITVGGRLVVMESSFASSFR